MPLLPDQLKARDYILTNKAAGIRSLLMWYGTIRSGKSYGACRILLDAAQASPHGNQYIVGGYRGSQVSAIYGAELSAMLGDQPFSWSQNRFTWDNGTIDFLTAEAAARVQGYTLDGLVLDELPNLNRSFVHQAENRVSKPGAFRIYTANHPPAQHWTTKFYHDRIISGAIDGLVIHSNIADNIHVDDDFVQGRIKEMGADDPFLAGTFVDPNAPVYNTEPGHPRGRVLIKVIFMDRGGYPACVSLWQNGHIDITPCDLPADMTIIDARLHMLGRKIRGNSIMFCYDPRRVEPTRQMLKTATVGDDLGTLIADYKNIGPDSEPVLATEIIGEVMWRLGLEITP